MSGKKKYPLQVILKIRKIKQDAALTELSKQKVKLTKHIKKIEKQEWRIERFAQWLPEEETRLFNKIMKQAVKKDAVNDVKARIEEHRVRQKAHDERLKKLLEEKETIEKDLQIARNTYNQLTGEIQKLQNHQDQWVSAYDKEQEEMLEKEIEESRRKR